jgi:hypothetical protein
MSINRISKVVLAAGLLGPAGLPLRAATISAVSFPDPIGPAFFTNHWGFAQGVAIDSSNVYHLFTTALSKQGYTNLTSLLPATFNVSPFAGMTNDYNHLGAGCCYGGNLYVAAEMYHGCGNATNASIAVFDAQSLALKSMNLVSNYQGEISAVAITPDGVVYTTDFCDGSRLFKYDLNFNYLGPVILSTNIPYIQGITCYNNLLLVIADAGASGNLWVVDPTSGHCSLLANLQVAGNTEWEGIAVFNGTLLACEGATGSLLYYTLSAPAITSEPQPLSVTDGSPAILSVTVNGESPMTYQWLFNGTSLPGASSASLAMPNVALSNAGIYSVVITNGFGATTSSPAALTVILPFSQSAVPAINVSGQTGAVINVDYLSTLTSPSDWTSLTSLSLTSTSQYVFDASIPLPAERYYRAWTAGATATVPALHLDIAQSVTLTGNIGDRLQLQYLNAGTLTNWTSITNITLTSTNQTYLDVSSIGQPGRKYRVMPAP